MKKILLLLLLLNVPAALIVRAQVKMSAESPANVKVKMPVKMEGMAMPGMKKADMTGGKGAYEQAKANLGTIRYAGATQPPHTVHYDLFVTDTIVRYAGKSKHAIAVNGCIPMPTLTFTEGDTAEIVVHNRLKEPTGLHWHGVFLPNKEDGVPYLTQMPIPPGKDYTYSFQIRQHGTHWYHSHYKLQEQVGMYGAFIMNKRQEWIIPTVPVVLSEWSNMSPHEIDRNLHTVNDWFSIQKGSGQSYLEAIKTGNFGAKVTNEWKRMLAMDVSDVYYDRFLINGSSDAALNRFKAGDKVRLRIANGGASTYFWLRFAGGKMTIVASDGNDVEPVEVDRLIIGVSETYDVVVTIPENKSYEFQATSEDRTGHASLWLGSGERVGTGDMPGLNYFAGMRMMNRMMDMHGNMRQMKGMRMQNQAMDMNEVMYPESSGGPEMQMPSGAKDKTAMNGMPAMDGMDMGEMDGMDMTMPVTTKAGSKEIVTLNYNMLRSTSPSTLPAKPWRELQFELSGNMNRYVWTIDNRTVSESDRVLIKKGENLRIVLYNNTMMRHPMHLHGHDFRILNTQGDFAPLKNVLDISPMERDTIEFNASEADGDWFFHCHILYHMMSGMGRIFHYEGTQPNPEITDPALAQRKLYWDDQMPHLMARVALESSGTEGNVMVANTRWGANLMWDLGRDAMMGYETEATVGRYLGRNQWLFPYIGFDYHYRKPGGNDHNIFGNDEKNLFGQQSNKDDRHTVIAGIAYTLPMLMVADARVDGNGKFRFQLGREDIPLTERLRMKFSVNTDKEYEGGFRYIFTRFFSLSAHYDSDMGIGGGITLSY